MEEEEKEEEEEMSHGEWHRARIRVALPVLVLPPPPPFSSFITPRSETFHTCSGAVEAHAHASSPPPPSFLFFFSPTPPLGLEPNLAWTGTNWEFRSVQNGFKNLAVKSIETKCPLFFYL